MKENVKPTEVTQETISLKQQKENTINKLIEDRRKEVEEAKTIRK